MADIVTFDPLELLIEEIDQGAAETELDVVEIYSEWKDWLLASAGSRLAYPQAFSVIGGDPTDGGQSAPSFFFLENGWRFRPANYSHQVTLVGNLYVRGGGRIDVPTVGGFQVNVRQSFTILQVDVSGTAAVDPDTTLILARVTEIWQRMGLDVANPLQVTNTSIQVGAISIAITGPDNAKTVQRS